ncbi:hypothetical protein [Roseateles sp.]|uniref:hypothetical protein n=1 Tax=Roseateles sp. TaxID=1971397 RepID=UPI0031DD2189
MVGEYIGRELARREKRQLIRKLVPESSRSEWVQRRCQTICRELRVLAKEVEKLSLPLLFGNGDFPEAERFVAIQPAINIDTFVAFINICQRCFVESIDRYAKTAGLSNYFWTTIKSTYPNLWEALQRIRVYRNNDLHLELNPTVQAELARYLDQDLEGRRLTQIKEPWFALQQAVLDELMLSIQYELARHS